MEKNSKKSTGVKKEDCEALTKALRSSGILLPESEDEVQSFNQIHGEATGDLPQKFKSVDFMFAAKSSAKIISITEPLTASSMAYAARDGQDLPDHIQNKMKALKEKNRKRK